MGIDIGERRVHLLEFGGGGRLRVTGYGSAAVPEYAVADDGIDDTGAVGDAVSQALAKSGINSRHAAVAMSGPAVISKIIEMPSGLSDADIEEQIHHEADAYIPYPIDEVFLDFRVIEPDPANPAFNRVMLAACRRDTVTSYLEALRESGLTIEVVDLASAALENACHLLIGELTPSMANVSYAVFDIRSDQTRLTVQRDGASVYTRDLTLSTRRLFDSLIEKNDLLDENALLKQLGAGSITGGAVVDELSEFAANASVEIEQALQFFASVSTYDESIDEVIITGEVGLFPGSESVLADHCERPLRLGNPIAGVPASHAAKKGNVEWHGPALSVASGLALRSVR